MQDAKGYAGESVAGRMKIPLIRQAAAIGFGLSLSCLCFPFGLPARFPLSGRVKSAEPGKSRRGGSCKSEVRVNCSARFEPESQRDRLKAQRV